MKNKAILVMCIAITTLVIGLTLPKNVKSNTYNTTPEFALLDDNQVSIPDDVQDSINKDLKEKYGENYQEVLKQNNKASETGNKIQSYYTIYSTKAKVYPDYYGGMYINDDQKLVLQIVEENIPISDTAEYRTYSEVIKVADNMEIEYVKYSYNELKEIDDKIKAYFSSEYADYDNLVANYVDFFSNKVIVELNENIVEFQNEFRTKVVDSKLVEFKKGKEISPAAAPGEKIRLTVNYNNAQYYPDCTRGYRVRLNYAVSGFITSGHCVTPQMVGSSVGVGTLNKYQFSGKVDAAFIQTTTTITNTLPSAVSGISTLNTTSSSSIAGGIIGMYGAVSNGKTGSIINPSVSYPATHKITGATVYLTDQVYTNIIAAEGDSGGPVFSTYKGESLGIVEGVDTGNNLYMTYTKFTNIASAFGVTRY